MKKLLIVLLSLMALIIAFSSCMKGDDLSDHKHTPSEPKKTNAQLSTCTEDGHYLEIVYCTDCKYILSKETKPIPAHHTPGEAHTENNVSYTCTTDGSYDTVVRCTACSEIISSETTVPPVNVAISFNISFLLSP